MLMLLDGSSLLTERIVQVAAIVVDLQVASILAYGSRGSKFWIGFAADLRETPFLGNNDLLATRELVSSTSESLNDDRLVGVLCSNREQDLTNVDTGDGAVGLAPSATHTSLESIGSSAGQHLVDTDDVEWMNTDTKMERVLARGLCNVLVGADTGGFKSFR